MSLQLNISAGQFFDLIRPALLVISACLSTWTLASARRRGLPLHISLAWALGTLFFPPIVFPLYLVAGWFRKQKDRTQQDAKPPHDTPSRFAGKTALLLVYAVVVLSGVVLYLYRDFRSVDAHLARATQAKVRGDRAKSINEYRAALRIEENPHTRKLLAYELSDAGDLIGALAEFRLAEQGGEPDETISFQVAALLDSLKRGDEATLEYQRFLKSKACTEGLPDRRCETAKRRLSSARN